jgi:hypothetical protein
MKHAVLQLGLIAAIFVTGHTENASATYCPPMSFPMPQQNLAKNPGFDICSSQPVICQGAGCASSPPSAAADWRMHTDNSLSKITTQCVPSKVPQNGGTKMLQVTASKQEGGVFQQLPASQARRMLSAWVLVRRGHIVLQLQGGNTGPVAWSTKIGEWEQLRVCTDGTVPSDLIVIYNEDPNGGIFYVDRIEVRNTP